MDEAGARERGVWCCVEEEPFAVHTQGGEIRGLGEKSHEIRDMNVALRWRARGHDASFWPCREASHSICSMLG